MKADASSVRHALRFDPDLAFRARSTTIFEYLEPKPGDLILDAGCGLGFTLYLLERYSESEIHGLDASKVRIGAAGARPGDRRARVVIGDIGRLPYADGTFDKAVASEVLEHLDDDHAAARELARVLRPGGVIAVTVPHTDYPLLWDPLNFVRERLAGSHFARPPWSGIWTDHRRLYRPRDLQRLLEQAGLEVLECRLHTRYVLPFSHNLVYGLGAHFVSSGNDGIGHRARLWEPRPLPLRVRLATAAFSCFEWLNKRQYARGPAVSLCVKARRPSAPDGPHRG